MQSYETSATVEELGTIRVAGVPFEAGTRVEIKITPALNGTESTSAAVSHRAAQLLSALDKARNVDTVGPLRRAELYDRDMLH